MIVLTRLNDAQFAINPDLIERIQANPDTTLVMVDGSKYIVTESMDDVIAKIAEWRSRIILMAQDVPPVVHRPGPELGLVPPVGSATDPAPNAPVRPVPLRPRNK